MMKRCWLAASASTKSADRATRKLFELADPPTALATGNNLATIGAMHALRELGLRVPDDVALVGFDDFEWADYFEPRLTVIAQPCQEIGREAASLLIERIGAPEGNAGTIRLKPELVVRTSCGCGGFASEEGRRSRPAARRVMSAPVLAMSGIEKSFGGVHALRGVDFDLRAGEVHALLGENGAGKSTLMNILAGVIAPDRGEIRVDGAPVRFANPRDAQASGIATIFQELDLVPGLDITANLFLGHELMRAGGRLDNARMEREARARMESAGVDIDVRRRVHELSIGQRQLVAIVKALSYATRVLVMDEPTAALSAAEAERLFKVVRAMRERGVGIVYISHRLEEVPRVADRVTVLRDGRRVGEEPANAPQARLVRLLVGRPFDEMFPPRADALGPELLRLDHAPFLRPHRGRGLAGAARRLAHRACRRDRRPCRRDGRRAHRIAVGALWRGAARALAGKNRSGGRAGASSLRSPRRGAPALPSSPTTGAAAA